MPLRMVTRTARNCYWMPAPIKTPRMMCVVDFYCALNVLLSLSLFYSSSLSLYLSLPLLPLSIVSITIVIVTSPFSSSLFQIRYILCTVCLSFSFSVYVSNHQVSVSPLQWGSTALIRAAGKAHAGCVRLLLDAGAQKVTRDSVRVGPSRAVKNAFFFLTSVSKVFCVCLFT